VRALLSGHLPLRGARWTNPRGCVVYNRRQQREGHGVTSPGDDTAAQADNTRHRGLVARLAAQDESALEELYDVMAGRVYGLALRITGSAPAAEEVVSDTYLQVWQQAQRYDAQRGSVLTWVLTICRSRALDSLRRREPAESHPEPETLRPDLFNDEACPLNLLLTLEKNTALYAACMTLSGEQQELIALAFFRGMTHQEIAAHTGRPLGSIKTSLRKAMHCLQPLLQDANCGVKESP
jgi:RNA polymerase sigma factor (sigma-70 family)